MQQETSFKWKNLKKEQENQMDVDGQTVAYFAQKKYEL